jgi:CheY-like chemotaxis protein
MPRILVIDDNELIAKMLDETLTEDGYEVRTAHDANTGYSTAIEFMPDLILMDIQLPDVTGFDLCRLIKNRSELRSVPIIMITGTARSTEDKVKGFQMGIDDYLLKPFDMPELLERVRAVLRRSEGREPSPAPFQFSELAPAPPPDPKGPERVPVSQAMARTILAPKDLPEKPFVPGISLVFLLVTLGLCYAALALTAGGDVSPTLVGLSVIGLWGLAVAVLVMAGTVLGIRISWKEGAGVISLAGTPILLKLVGALVASLCTTLSPFYYSAGLPLFWEGAPSLFARVDGFEIWCAVLLWTMLRRWPGSSKQKAWVVTLLVWGASIALAAAMSGMGKS